MKREIHITLKGSLYLKDHAAAFKTQSALDYVVLQTLSTISAFLSVLFLFVCLFVCFLREGK